MAGELEDETDLAVRLRVALSLCPVDALTHRKSERVSRFEKIRRHIVAEGLVSESQAERLAEAVDNTLDAWLVERARVSTFRAQLLERDGSKCRACHVDFAETTDARTVKSRDPFKLAWVDPARNFAPSVDHRDPVSKFGTNDLDNLWLLCRFCNSGKGDGSPLMLKRELEFAALLPWRGQENPPANLVVYSSEFGYRVLARHSFACATCGTRERELTVRKHRKKGLAILSNMTCLCVECAEAD